MTSHKHADLIKAWADGAEIEWLEPRSEEWLPVETPCWDSRMAYRVKPAPDPYADLKAAHARGETIQFRWTSSSSSRWADLSTVEWIQPAYCYRVKPKSDRKKIEVYDLRAMIGGSSLSAFAFKVCEYLDQQEAKTK